MLKNTIEISGKHNINLPRFALEKLAQIRKCDLFEVCQEIIDFDATVNNNPVDVVVPRHR